MLPVRRQYRHSRALLLPHLLAEPKRTEFSAEKANPPSFSHAIQIPYPNYRSTMKCPHCPIERRHNLPAITIIVPWCRRALRWLGACSRRIITWGENFIASLANGGCKSISRTLLFNAGARAGGSKTVLIVVMHHANAIQNERSDLVITLTQPLWPSDIT
jgi:hypothetical protein